MDFYLAPLEGITRYTYRNAIRDFFGENVKKYYTPFFQPHTKRKPSTKEMRDVLPANNENIFLVPQLLTNNAADMLAFQRDMCALGYTEVNLNIGCPSGTVVSKGRGSGFLKETGALDEFLSQVYENAIMPVSVKTRIGFYEPDEVYALMDIFNKYPIHELTIHPRVGRQMYRGGVYKKEFLYCLLNSKNPVCYSGDINSETDLEELLGYLHENGCDNPFSVMLGRGMVGNPALIRQLSGGKKITLDEIKAFHDRLVTDIIEVFGNKNGILFAMKELWVYMSGLFDGGKEALKDILKAKNYDAYCAAVRAVFELNIIE